MPSVNFFVDDSYDPLISMAILWTLTIALGVAWLTTSWFHPITRSSASCSASWASLELPWPLRSSLGLPGGGVEWTWVCPDYPMKMISFKFIVCYPRWSNVILIYPDWFPFSYHVDCCFQLISGRGQTFLRGRHGTACTIPLELKASKYLRACG
jgi:hypothetical protein